MFFVSYVVLVLPIVIWYIAFVFTNMSEQPSARGFYANVVRVLGGEEGGFSVVSMFMAPITVLIAAQISANANSWLTIIAVLFFAGMVAAVLAPLTMGDYVHSNIPAFLPSSGNADDWIAKADLTFRRYGESFASTAAVLLGLQLKSST